jgi:phosphohistidine swiveling domain-containing protein
VATRKWFKAMNKRQHTLLPNWPGFLVLGGLFYEDLIVSNVFTVWESGLVDYYLDSQDCLNASVALSNRVKENPEFWEEYDQKVYPLGQEYYSKLLEINPSSGTYRESSDSELLKAFDEVMEMLELNGGTLTLARIHARREIDEFFRQKIGDPQEIQRAHELVCIPVRQSWVKIAETEFQRIVVKAAEESLGSEAVKELLQRHQHRFGWLTTDLHYGSPLSVEELQEQLEEEIANSPEEKLLDLDQRNARALEERSDFIEMMEPPKYIRGLMQVMSFETWLKTYRRYFTTQVVHYNLPLFNEIANRARIESEDAWWATPPEIRDFLALGKLLPDGILQERRKLMVMITADGENTLFLGSEAKKLLVQEIEQERVTYSKVLKGVPASPGKVCGRAKVVMDHARVDDLVEQGEVIVATQSPPTFIRAITRCAALVIEEGAVTSHASVLAREADKPCIVGVKGATTIIRTGDELGVDASEGVVEILGRAT